MRVDGLISFAEDAGTTMTQLISTGLKDTKGLFTLEKTYDVLAVAVEPDPVRVSDRISSWTEVAGENVGSGQVSSEELFGELSLAKAQIVENMRAAVTYQAALLAPALMDMLVGHFTAAAGQRSTASS